MVATIFVLRSMRMNLAAREGASPEVVKHLLSSPVPEPRSRGISGRGALQERWRPTRGCG